ncbi:hypothetical protein Tco_0556264 [Tanacetum coccineum]
MKIHHGGKLTSRPNRKYVSGKVKFMDMIDSKERTIEVLHRIVKIALSYDDDIVNLIKYVSQHKVIEVYIEHHESLVESLDGDNDNDVDNEQGIKRVNKQGIGQGIEGDNEQGIGWDGGEGDQRWTLGGNGEKFGWWFEQDIDGENEDGNEKKLVMVNEEGWMS